MIIGTGIDIVEIQRIGKAASNPRFFRKIYTAKEQKMFEERSGSIQVVSGNFAAKEAVAKALGTGFGSIGWLDVEILRNNKGRPCVNLYGRALEKMKQLGGSTVWVSISHSGEYAIAQAVIEG